MDGFNILSKIGEGSYSTVLKVQRIEDGNIYALKRVKFYKLSDKEKENALNEIRILASVKNKNVISYKEAFFDEKDSSLGIVMEYADKGDLFQLITERKKTKNYFTEQEVWKIFIQLLNGLKALHDFKILHRDIKSANVFLFKGGICKLGDLNVSKVARKGLGYTQTGTPYYASPEVWEEKPYDSKSDVWSLGCVMYEMITLRPPFQAKSMEELYKKVMRGNYPRIPTKYSEDLSDAIKLMIQVEVGARPSCEELLKMPMITKRIEFFNNNKDIDITEEQNESINKKFELLKTIMVPNKLENLAKNLPKPNYDTEGNIRSFQNSNRNVHKQYGSLTLSNTDLLPNIKKDKIIIKNSIENNSKSIITESNKNKIQIINNRNNKSLNVKENNYEYRPRIPKSLPKNDNIIKNKQKINKNIILPNLYGNYKANISLKNLNINNKSSNVSYKIMNSENNVSKNNLNNIKVIDGNNIYGNNKNIINSIGLKKKKYLINQVNNDIGKMMIEKISKPKPFNYNLNNYSKGNLDKDFLKIIHQRKKRMIYLGKI
jgi:NIMA (never in mitosis gene a)-related kinase